MQNMPDQGVLIQSQIATEEKGRKKSLTEGHLETPWDAGNGPGVGPDIEVRAQIAPLIHY